MVTYSLLGTGERQSQPWQFGHRSVGKDGINCRAKINKELRGCSRWFKTVWRAVAIASSVDLFTLYGNWCSAGGRLEMINDDETSVSKHFLPTGGSVAG